MYRWGNLTELTEPVEYGLEVVKKLSLATGYINKGIPMPHVKTNVLLRSYRAVVDRYGVLTELTKLSRAGMGSLHVSQNLPGTGNTGVYTTGIQKVAPFGTTYPASILRYIVVFARSWVWVWFLVFFVLLAFP